MISGYGNRLPDTPLTNARFLKPAEVMKITMHTDVSAFWQFIRRNGVPFIRLGARRYVFEETALRAWMKTRTVGKGCAA